MAIPDHKPRVQRKLNAMMEEEARRHAQRRQWVGLGLLGLYVLCLVLVRRSVSPYLGLVGAGVGIFAIVVFFRITRS